MTETQPQPQPLPQPLPQLQSQSPYVPTFAEETFIVNCYGTDEDIDRFNVLMEDPTDRGHLVEMIILIEAIKNRNQLGMDWNCCWRCQRYTYCEINWYRGERGLKKTCCPNCLNYSDCNRIFISQRIGTCMAPEEPRRLIPPSPPWEGTLNVQGAPRTGA